MPKDIKIKEKDSHYIRKLDRRIAFTSRVKRNVSNQYEKLKKEDNNEQNVENANPTNYATTKVMRTGDRSARESTYIITGVSKNTYRKIKMKIAEKKEEKNNKLENENNTNDIKSRNKELTNRSKEDSQERVKTIKTRDSSTNESTNTLTKKSNVKSYQKQKLIKEKQNFKNIKEHSYKNNGVKTNNNMAKIKTRDSLKNTTNLSLNKNKMQVHTSNEIMKKSRLQNIKQNSIKIKNIAQKTGKIVVNITKKVVQRYRCDNCIWRWICFNNFTYYYANCRYVWLCFWILIF